MGNTSSGKSGGGSGGGGGTVAQRVSQAGRTGVCTLREQKLTEVGCLVGRSLDIDHSSIMSILMML